MTYCKIKGWRMLVDEKGNVHMYLRSNPRIIYKMDEFLQLIRSGSPVVKLKSPWYHGKEVR